MNKTVIVLLSTAALAGTAKVVDIMRTNIYDKNGYNNKGYDRDGYNRNGYDISGYNRNGYDRSGYNRDGYDKKGYDRDGYGRNGYNRNGFNRGGYTYESTLELIEMMKKEDLPEVYRFYKNKKYRLAIKNCRTIVENIYKYYAKSYFGCRTNVTFDNCIDICANNGFLSKEYEKKIDKLRLLCNDAQHEYSTFTVNQACFVLKTTQEELEIFRKKVIQSKNIA